MAQKKKSRAVKTKSKKASASKRNQKEIKVDRSEIIRFAIGFLAFFIILTFFPAINSGWFGEAITKFLKGLFGPMYYVVPFLMLIVDISWGRDRESNCAKTKYFLYALEFIFISLVVQIAVAGCDSMPITSLYQTGIIFESAGLISGAVAMMLCPHP